jgi:hypothetical protein
MALLLAGMGGMAWMFAKVVWLYQASEGGRWTSLTEMRSAGWSGTGGFGAVLCLAAASAFAGLAAVRCPGRPRWAGMALLLAGGLPLAIWVLLLVESVQGTNVLGLR